MIIINSILIAFSFLTISLSAHYALTVIYVYYCLNYAGNKLFAILYVPSYHCKMIWYFSDIARNAYIQYIMHSFMQISTYALYIIKYLLK